MIEADAREDLLVRGYSRRQLGRIAALIGGGAMLAPLADAAQAQSNAARGVAGAVQIGANECWTGPFPEAAAAAAQILAQGNRYDPGDHRGALLKTVAAVEQVPEERILAWPGSGDPLVRSVISFCSPTRGLVTADPTFESAWRAATWLGAPLAKVPMQPGKGADVRAMLRANPDAGLYYICTPNNPTGTVTPIADIAWLLANKPAQSVVLVDEAYLHFSDAPSALPLAAARGDVVVMRTFSKLFGMAGMRLGLTFAHPDLHKKMMRYDGQQVTGTLPMTAVACGNAAYPMADAIRARRAEMIAVREATVARLARHDLRVHPNSQANMIMVDWKTRKAAEMQAALLARKVQIGRSWPIWPTVSRVTIGSVADMRAFNDAVDAVLA
ncbi:pyridoxal phosphate-dependent aminotransferase [Sphingomonas aracearum]|uniref:Aminotransferase class I/II-fold pyridoxal phosphate-dependent enzyme n=1 Tax=Sphingomonas aracearum TaxID=2283317 RepID=A0A369VX85_9SPHN|nr:pyridoxal phosphate-dependent aminotransferase [Sphingomonas aracearum]RDE06994.1 aminotransferase class I/II-fold pyridoxal phosphate-dependent enzyme [Sphingomonas aracearum]